MSKATTKETKEMPQPIKSSLASIFTKASIPRTDEITELEKWRIEESWNSLKSQPSQIGDLRFDERHCLKQ